MQSLCDSGDTHVGEKFQTPRCIAAALVAVLSLLAPTKFDGLIGQKANDNVR